MKIRNGFVSNSSSSSFTCDVCGKSYEGWDASPLDSSFDCHVCENEHIMCDEHLKADPQVVMVKGCDHEFDREAIKFCPECGEAAWVESDEGYISSKCCPICQFEIYAETEMSKYLAKTRGISRDEVFAEVKSINKRRKKLYESEYITYVCRKFSLTDEILLKEIKDKFGEFSKYAEFLRG
jgi:hypothetical protein